MRELESAAHRFAAFAAQVLAPAVYPRPAPLQAEVLEGANEAALEQARFGPFVPVPMGWRWGPVWATAWFRVAGRVPRDFAGRPVALRFSSGTEALLYRDGAPLQGLGPHHDSVMLFDPANGGEPFELFIQAVCNRPLGATLFWWDDAESHARWREDKPGRLERCELALFDRSAWQLAQTFEFARQWMMLQSDDAPRGRRLHDALQAVLERCDPRDPGRSAAKLLPVLVAALRGGGAERGACGFAVGHAHIDTAWLWRTRETRRKCLRTFASVLRLMERHPAFAFVCSQAQQYAWVQQDAPQLFAQIARRVEEGRWEPGGALWVEPDGNMPAGESFVRQILHAARYWRQAFGERGRQRFAFLPDTFGFAASLPQIFRLAGLDTFITSKLAWNETNEFPHVSFLWRGIDGSEIVAHCIPGREYNAQVRPAELDLAQRNLARLDRSNARAWLLPFGHGDGGGGPTDAMVHCADLARDCEGLPPIQCATVAAFCDELHARLAQQAAADRPAPVWDGELYLERHRGTLTTQAWLKKANRDAEQALRIAEWLYFAGPRPPAAAAAAAARAKLERAWKLLLLNQFHDILPGSSIGAVYDDARADHEEIRRLADSLCAEAQQPWVAAVDARGSASPVLAFNPASRERAGVVEVDGRLHWVRAVPALGVRLVQPAGRPERTVEFLSDRSLANGRITFRIDAAGRIAELCGGDGRRVNAEDAAGRPRPLNQLVLYDDRPRFWEAWDLDAEYEPSARPVDSTAGVEIRLVDRGPLRRGIEVSRPLGAASRLTQRYLLDAQSPRLDIHTVIEWRERRTLLRALFPVDVRSRRATYEIPFGHIERPTHRSNPWERAMFEVCAHRWMDLSQPGLGVALLNDAKYGHSCHGNVLGLSLLRGTMFPDPDADLGTHEFTYSLMPHGGDWRVAGVADEAEALNAPLWAAALEPRDGPGRSQDAWAPLEIEFDGAARAQVAALKPAEDGDRLIARLVETHGGSGVVRIHWRLPVRRVEPVDLLESPRPEARVSTALARASGAPADAPPTTTWDARPFQILTLALELS